MSRTRRVALVTSAEYRELTPDDRLLVAPLRRRGIAAEPAVWNDPGVRWGEFDSIILRSTWDYHLASNAFAAWIAAVGAFNLANPATIVRWNMEKTYLRELAAGGIPVPPTVWVAPNERPSLGGILHDTGWVRAVVKPTVSASAYETWIVAGAVTDADEVRFRRLCAASGAMVQKFMEPIRTAGEWSLLFFGKEYSHAVVKRPVEGDFRVQSEYGGTVETAAPPASLLAQARAVIASVPGPLLYARVDGVVEEGTFMLMELELIEPTLYLDADPAAPDRFCDALEGMTFGA
jgi:glutathione synthase/RimK-type ligase-like ATP-grasp enzyme